jgi:RNA polymerase sigma factor (sigma-70 family)
MTQPLPAFQAFFDEHWGVIVRFMRASVGAGEAEDCAQEAMLAALRAYPDFDGRNPRGWVLAIARNKAIDHHRARRRDAIPIAELPDPGKLDRRLGAIADGDALRRASAGLSEGQRSAVVLRHVLDLPYSEIGPALGCSEAAARQRVREALGHLRVALRSETVATATTGGSR